MNALLESWIGDERGIVFLRFMLDVSVRVSLLCLIAGAATLAMRRSSAYTRKMVWAFALAGVLLFPFLAGLSPVWSVSILPDLERWGAFGRGGAERIISAGASDAGIDLPADGTLFGTEDSAAFFTLSSGWAPLVLLVWAAGASTLLIRLALTRLFVRRAMRDAEPVDRSWYRLESDLRKRIGLGHAVPVLKSDRTGTAVTAGVLYPVIILPKDADGWSALRRRLVLSHELAHVKRKDGLLELAASMALVLHWFNPFVWRAVARLRIERERDCDNAVLNDGARPSEYASLLLDLAADVSGLGRPAWRLSTISQSSHFKKRLFCILDPAIDRTTGNRRCVMKAVALILAVIIPLSLFGVWDTRAQEKLPPPPPKQDAPPPPTKEEAAEKINQLWEQVAAKEGSAAAMVAGTIDEIGLEAGMKKCAEMKKKEGGEYYFDEKEFNLLGYRYLYNGQYDKAIGVLKLNVKNYPDSWNAHDSLGEAFAHKGELEKAQTFYQKSLELNPENENGKKMLQKIEQKMQAGEKKIEKKMEKKAEKKS